MRDRTGRAPAACASLAVALSAFGLSSGASAQQPGLSAALPFGCVTQLVDVRRGGYASHFVIDGPFAYGEWRASGIGGQSLWKRAGTAWCEVSTGVAVLDRRMLVAYGVPAAVAGRLLASMHATPELAPPILHPFARPIRITDRSPKARRAHRR